MCVEWRGQTETFHTWCFLSSQWEWEGRKETSGSSRTVEFLRSHCGLGDKWGWKVGKSLTFFFRQDYSAQTLERRAPAFVFPVRCRILVVKTSGFAATKQKSKAEKLGLCRFKSTFISHYRLCCRSGECPVHPALSISSWPDSDPGWWTEERKNALKFLFFDYCLGEGVQ